MIFSAYGLDSQCSMSYIYYMNESPNALLEKMINELIDAAMTYGHRQARDTDTAIDRDLVDTLADDLFEYASVPF